MKILLSRFLLVLALAAPAFLGAAEKPNIIYLLLDDAGYGDLSCYGQKKFSTPNMDRLAEEGMKFTDHYSGSTVCAPTRCVLMTGKHSGHAHIRGNDEWRERGEVWSFSAMNRDPNLEGRAVYPVQSLCGSVPALCHPGQSRFSGRDGIGPIQPAFTGCEIP